MQQTLEANPHLLAPIEGVFLEQYAYLAAHAGSLDAPHFASLLAQQGFDLPRWLRVSTAWNERLTTDSTHTLTALFGRALSRWSEGLRGTAPPVHAGEPRDDRRTGSTAPMTFERCCEIQGALQAWSRRGESPIARLQQHFATSPSDFADALRWWLSQLEDDPSRHEQYTQLVAHYERHYAQRR